MARPRGFDTEGVLAAARDLFWARGFQAASLDELARTTGVHKPSLYGAFGDKAQLFGLVLGRYHSGLLDISRRMLGGEGSGRNAIRAWLLGFLSFCSGDSGARGCMSVNAALEAAVLDARIREMIDDFQAETEALLVSAFERGKKQGEFHPDLDAAAAARALLTAQSGLMVLARGRPLASVTLAAMEHLLDAIAPKQARP